jgi:ferredoxin
MRALACWGLLIAVGGAALPACDPGEDPSSDGAAGSGGSSGTGGGGGTGGSRADARPPDTAAAAAYRWIAIVDDNKSPMCNATGPGADIDSVDLVRGGGSPIGVGLRGSAAFVDNPAGFPSNVPCTGCGAAMAMCPHSGAQAAARIEGIPDGKSYQTMTDTGYISLNAGLLWVQIGQANGNTPAQDIKAGDTVVVHEVDKTYLEDGSAEAGCGCDPEKYLVYAYVAKDLTSARIQLKPTMYRPLNTACGAISASTEVGCGTTTFSVP